MTGMAAGVVLLFGGMGFAGVWYILGLFGNKKQDQSNATEDEVREPDGGRLRWFEVLGVSETSDWQTIKVAYLQKISRYHPDKFAALDEEFHDLALGRAKAINEAFEAAKRLRGRR